MYYICMSACMLHACCMHVCRYVGMWVGTYVCIYIYMYMYILCKDVYMHAGVFLRTWQDTPDDDNDDYDDEPRDDDEPRGDDEPPAASGEGAVLGAPGDGSEVIEISDDPVKVEDAETEQEGAGQAMAVEPPQEPEAPAPSTPPNRCTVARFLHSPVPLPPPQGPELPTEPLPAVGPVLRPEPLRAVGPPELPAEPLPAVGPPPELRPEPLPAVGPLPELRPEPVPAVGPPPELRPEPLPAVTPQLSFALCLYQQMRLQSQSSPRQAVPAPSQHSFRRYAK